MIVYLAGKGYYRCKRKTATVKGIMINQPLISILPFNRKKKTTQK
jgi:hypothetical protein